jgi:hypothetical protein
LIGNKLRGFAALSSLEKERACRRAFCVQKKNTEKERAVYVPSPIIKKLINFVSKFTIIIKTINLKFIKNMNFIIKSIILESF